MRIHILATVRKPELLDAALLVFKTLRVGFPDNPVFVDVNTLDRGMFEAVKTAAESVGAEVEHVGETIHHDWIGGLTWKDPFMICDTDMVFHDRFDMAPIEAAQPALSGALIPRFRDPFTRCITQARLHTSLLYFDPEKVDEAVEKWFASMPDTPFNPKIHLIDPVVVPAGAVNIFHDTCCLLYQAIGGLPFTAQQMEAYDHLHCGTWSDIISSALPGLEAAHREIFKNPALAARLKPVQAAFYKTHEC